ncbi:MAG: SDR family oxidoreductase [Chloroherpetonaceae bacterium]|nr:SDR family oxidoreductase [Chloroherpetonaceae bacterium]
MKILLTGSSGLLGGNLCRLFFTNGIHEILATQGSNFKLPSWFALGHQTQMLNLSYETDLWNIVSQWKPECIIHTAAMSDPVTCEIKPAEAEIINRFSTLSLAKICGLFGTKLIYISTDLVFDGEKGMYSETDETHPISIYAQTKLDGELAVQTYCESYTILRTTIMLGHSPRATRGVNEQLLNAYREGKSIKFFADEYRTPISASTVAKVALEFSIGSLREVSGIFHTVGNERLSRFQFGAKVCKSLSIPESAYQSVLLSEIISIPPRPKDCSLSNNKLKSILPFSIPSIEEEIEGILKEKPPSLS